MIKHPFEYQSPTSEQTDAIIKYRDALKMVYNSIVEGLPECRERSLAITKLEEASMWINKAIVFHYETS